MTLAVAYFCSDGIVVAADSMLTPMIGAAGGPVGVGHHHGVKVYVLPGPQIFGFAGDQGQAARFRLCAEASSALIARATGVLDYPIHITQSMIAQFHATGIRYKYGAWIRSREFASLLRVRGTDTAAAFR